MDRAARAVASLLYHRVEKLNATDRRERAGGQGKGYASGLNEKLDRTPVVC